jgi:pimeloyl-ACP methyl ester carboxylesterase
MVAQAALELSTKTDDGVIIRGERTGQGPAILLLHGLTATRRYVVMGSRTLERRGYSVISYDARGHGRSTGSPDRYYDYERLSKDLESVMDELGLERAVLAGASMGAHTALRLALENPGRVSALALITPAYDPRTHFQPEDELAYASWDALARGLRERGVPGFAAAYDFSNVPEQWRATVEKVIDQRLSSHEHLQALADALEVVPRSRPFESLEQLHALALPTIIIASRDEADPGHPMAVAETYAHSIPNATLVVEEPGRSPIAWQGGQLSKLITELADTIDT